HDDLALLQVVRDEHAGAEAGPSGGGTQGARQVAGGGAGQGGETEGAGGLQGLGDDAVLEGVGRVAGVVLDEQPAGDAEFTGQVVRLDQRGPARVEVRLAGHVGGDGQQRRVAPDVRGARLDAPAQFLGPVGREVVGDLQRAETLLAGEDGAERDAVAALAAGQRGGGAEVDVGGGGGSGGAGAACNGLHSHVRRGPFSSSSSRRISP